MPSRNKDRQQLASHPLPPQKTSAGRALRPRIPHGRCWRGCRRAGFHDDFSTWREMEMTGSARKVTERSWHPPSAAAGGTALPALSSRLAQGEAPPASGHLGPPRLTSRVLAAGCHREAELAHHIGPSPVHPRKRSPGAEAQRGAGRVQMPHRSTSQLHGPSSGPGAAFPVLAGLPPWWHHH